MEQTIGTGRVRGGGGEEFRIRNFSGLPVPDPLVRGMDPDSYSDPSVIKQKTVRNPFVL
jgi:hypothetical protein